MLIYCFNNYIMNVRVLSQNDKREVILMGTLKHVCMWEDNSWKRITIDKAVEIHPYGKVSANSGLFMCELCGQYVLLTEKGINRRHFRHDRAQKDKECPERILGSNGFFTLFNKAKYELPIRIKLNNKSFSFEIGFMQIPSDLITKKLEINIKPKNAWAEKFIYSRERLQDEGITYLSIGNTPYEKYIISVSGTNEKVHNYWPDEVSGIDPKGTLFDAKTGKKLVYDSDVEVGNKYYLLKKGCKYLDYLTKQYITLKLIMKKTISLETWCLYEVTANDYQRESAEFFFDYHCRLTDRPVKLQTVWPLYIKNPYVLKCNEKDIVMHIQGNSPNIKPFPYVYIQKYNIPYLNEEYVANVHCNGRQQLLTIGRAKILKYTYFWQERLDNITDCQKADVVDLKGNNFVEGTHEALPINKLLNITIPYDGHINIKRNGILVERRNLYADTQSEIFDISWNTEIEVYVGLDKVWKASFFKRKDHDNTFDENIMLKKLESYYGEQIELPHTIGFLVKKLNKYTAIQRWIYKCIRNGHMSRKAYRTLVKWSTSGKI